MSATRFILGLKSGNRRMTFRKFKTKCPNTGDGWTAQQLTEAVDELWREMKRWLTEEYQSFHNYVIGAMDRSREINLIPVDSKMCTNMEQLENEILDDVRKAAVHSFRDCNAPAIHVTIERCLTREEIEGREGLVPSRLLEARIRAEKYDAEENE